MDILEYNGTDFNAVLDFEHWRIGIINYGERFSVYTQEERHLLTDEAFLLLQGNAVLYEEGKACDMEYGKVYNIRKGVWHHVVLQKDAKVLVVENSNTAKENTERRYI